MTISLYILSGSLIKGILVFSMAAVGIISGSFSISILASKTIKAECISLFL
ncbi:hypothetical protein ABF215_01780 [Fusobacterium sp. THCT13E1]|uniref:hypothetical protein n=1 Tax=Fusobacterium ulcerans TaxID=861 RepID=UPI001E3032D9|nr:hypothetical protein [Fusobacterium ulcerans]